MSELAVRVRQALDSADLESFTDLLDPDVRWGPPEASSADCRNRNEVVAWWRRGRDAGARAKVTEIVEGNDRLLVGLRVTGTARAAEQGGAADRWQVLTVRDGRVVDIRGFEDRAVAAARAGVA